MTSESTDLQGIIEHCIELHSGDTGVYRSIKSCIEYYVYYDIYDYLQILATIYGKNWCLLM